MIGLLELVQHCLWMKLSGADWQGIGIGRGVHPPRCTVIGLLGLVQYLSLATFPFSTAGFVAGESTWHPVSDMQATLVVFLAGGDIVLSVSPLPCDMALTLPAGESLCSELAECHMVHGLPPLLLCNLPFDMVLTLSAGESLCSEVEECHMTLSRKRKCKMIHVLEHLQRHYLQRNYLQRKCRVIILLHYAQRKCIILHYLQRKHRMVVFLQRKHRVIIPFHHLPRKYSLMHLSLPTRPSPFVFSLCPLSEERYAPSVCPGEADVYMIVTKNKLQKDCFQIIELCFYCLFIFICVSWKKTQEARFDTFQQLMASQCVQDAAPSEVPMLTESPACLESEECTTIYCAPLYSTLADVKQGPTLLEECAEQGTPMLDSLCCDPSDLYSVCWLYPSCSCFLPIFPFSPLSICSACCCVDRHYCY